MTDPAAVKCEQEFCATCGQVRSEHLRDGFGEVRCSRFPSALPAYTPTTCGEPLIAHSDGCCEYEGWRCPVHGEAR